MYTNKIMLLVIFICVIFATIYKIYIHEKNETEQFTTNSTDKIQNNTQNNKTKNIKVYNFNTSWCGWSKRFQPEWDKFMDETKTNPLLSTVTALDVKCDDPNNNTMCESYKVPGYPYVLIEIDNNTKPYNGTRTSEALVQYMLKLL